MIWLLAVAVIVAAFWAVEYRLDTVHAEQSPEPARWCALCAREDCLHVANPQRAWIPRQHTPKEL